MITPSEFADVLLGLPALQVLELSYWFESHMVLPAAETAAGPGQPDMQPELANCLPGNSATAEAGKLAHFWCGTDSCSSSATDKADSTQNAQQER